MNKFKKVLALVLAFVMTMSLSLTAFAANDKGIEFTAEIESETDTSVVMVVKASETIQLDGLSLYVIIPDGWSIASIVNDDLNIPAGSINKANGAVMYSYEYTDGDYQETDYLVRVTYTKPADYAGEQVTLGANNFEISIDYGDVWEAGGEATTLYPAGPAPCEHVETKFDSDEENHWKVCANEECNAVIEGTTAAHTYEGATCTADGTCECGATGGKLDHDYATPKYDEDNHWNECVCGDKADVAAHDFKGATCTVAGVCDCGATGSKLDHDYATPKYDEDNHWNECVCGDKADVVAHTFDTLEGDKYYCACGASIDAPKYTVEFLGYKGDVVYTAQAIVGFEISPDDITAAEAAVAATAPYGYEFAGFDGEIAEGTVGAKFAQSEVEYTVNIIGLTGEATKSLKFDTGLTVTEPNVAAWKVNGVIVAAGESVTVYVAGDMTIEAVAETPAESSIAIIGKADNGKATVMVKAYIAGAVEYKTGVDYTLGDRTVTVYSKNYTAIDFMTGLNNAPAGIEAKAFIEIDGVKTYSAAVTF